MSALAFPEFADMRLGMFLKDSLWRGNTTEQEFGDREEGSLLFSCLAARRHFLLMALRLNPSIQLNWGSR